MTATNVLSEKVLRTGKTLDFNLHSIGRQLIVLKIEHAGLNALIDLTGQAMPLDELMFKRHKKRRLHLRDQIARLEFLLDTPEPA